MQETFASGRRTSKANCCRCPPLRGRMRPPKRAMPSMPRDCRLRKTLRASPARVERNMLHLSPSKLAGGPLERTSSHAHTRAVQMIEFPNRSRSYDRTRRAVRFWGYDSAIEASFFIGEDALKRIQPDVCSDELSFLNAFDSNRDLICAAAAKVYVRVSRGSYDLVAANF